MGDDVASSSSSEQAGHPLDRLYSRVLEQLRSIAAEAVEAERIRRTSGDAVRERSIYSRSAAPLPEGDGWMQGPPKEWLALLATFPLPDPARGAAATKKSVSELPNLMSFLTPSDQRGGRSPRLWSRGDWFRAIADLRSFVPSRDVAHIRQDVETTFEQLFAAQ